MKRIAIVEDNPDNRLLVRAILEDRFEIDEFESGAEALEGIRQTRPDVILLDISLPGMDGTEVLRQIRADDTLRHLRVIALTAHAMAGDREKYLSLSFNDYISKPILDEQLLLDSIAQQLSCDEWRP